MANNKLRNLRLVSPDLQAPNADAAAQPGFALVSMGELTAAEQRLVDQLVSAALPGSGIIAVARTTQPWDLRPVVMKVGEEQPSVLRLLGPLATSSQENLVRVQATFERSQAALQDTDLLFDWGQHDGQVWYRRTLYHSTLAHELSTAANWPAERILTFAEQLIEQVISLHAYGVVHGHIATTNIVIDPAGMPQLIDMGVAACQLQGGILRDLHLAPELAPGQFQVLPMVDAYGIGQVIKRLLLKAQRESLAQNPEEILILDAIAEKIQPMLSSTPRLRPNLHSVISSLRSLHANSPISSSQPASARGRIVPTSSVAGAGAQHIQLAQQHSSEPLIAQQQMVQQPGQQEPLSHEFAGQVRPAVRENKSMWWVYAIAVASLCFCAWTLRDRYQESALEVDAEQIKSAWMSGMPSQMRPVVEIATENPGSLAEQLLVRSAIRGETLPVGINATLLRIAFDNRWEAALSDDDRRVATTLGTAGLVRPKDASVLADLENRHPGVLLAIVASAPEQGATSLAKIPAAKLALLPGKYGSAFAAILSKNPNASCADEAVRKIARFATFGIERPADVAVFLSSDFSTRLSAISAVFAADEVLAKAILEAIIAHPNVDLAEPPVQWAKQWSLSQWELSAGGKLEILAGIAPKSSINAQYVGALFAHPAAELRKYAVTEARDRIAFSHPASLTVLSKLIEKPELLQPIQLLQLAKILENPEKLSVSELKQWFASKPSEVIVLDILSATAKQEKASLVDSLAAMYLNSQGWKPSAEQASVLRTHPDDYTRMVSYQALFASQTPEAFALLQESVRTEHNEEFRSQLAMMLEQLHLRLNK